MGRGVSLCYSFQNYEHSATQKNRSALPNQATSNTCSKLVLSQHLEKDYLSDNSAGHQRSQAKFIKEQLYPYEYHGKEKLPELLPIQQPTGEPSLRMAQPIVQQTMQTRQEGQGRGARAAPPWPGWKILVHPWHAISSASSSPSLLPAALWIQQSSLLWCHTELDADTFCCFFWPLFPLLPEFLSLAPFALWVLDTCPPTILVPINGHSKIDT